MSPPTAQHGSTVKWNLHLQSQNLTSYLRSNCLWQRSVERRVFRSSRRDLNIDGSPLQPSIKRLQGSTVLQGLCWPGITTPLRKNTNPLFNEMTSLRA
ncbi:hypothetical protein AVEN_36226-1 [Araneus ventricosus]|uniref:Uncharacterized protein n=1 Tax=Araneus ventricosus TaxID=182803 RepID=A0A4Y2ST66_ARAVE|nr:hypothetical protein AVEN_36226-1 [Araneus ventricosus]